MVIGGKRTPQMIPGFLTGRPMQAQTTSQRPIFDNDDHDDTTPPMPETQTTATPADLKNTLTEILVYTKNRLAAHTLMVPTGAGKVQSTSGTKTETRQFYHKRLHHQSN